MIKAICFDLDGVYFTEKGKKSFHNSLVEFTDSEEKVSHVLYKSPEMLEFVIGKRPENEFWQYVRTYLSLKLSDQDFRDLWVKDYEVDQKVRDTVLKAKEKGYITCTCSNNNIARIAELEKKFQFLSDFDVKIFSYQTGFVKPSKEIFEELIKQTKVNPDEIVYSDDREERLTGANELGINTFVYENFEQFLSELEKLGVAI